MFTQNSISKDLQDSILKVMEGNIKHPNQQKIDVHEPEKDEITADDFKKLRKMKKEDTDSQIQELAGKAAQQAAIAISLIKAGKKDGKMPKPMKEATKIIVHDDEAEDKKLIKKMIDKEKKVDEVEGSMPKTPKEKDLAAKHGHPGRIAYGDVLKARGVKMKEEVEELDELSKTTLGSYAKKATRDAVYSRHIGAALDHPARRSESPAMKAARVKLSQKYMDKSDKREYGATQAIDRLTKEEVEFEESVESNDTHFAKQSKKMQDAINLHLRKGKSYKEAVAASKVHVKEEVEELDELSKTTLGSYVKKATRDAVITRKIGADFEHQGKRAKSPGMKAASDMLSQRYKAKSFKRRDGVDKAVDRLTKEEVEQFDETVLVHATYEIKESYTFGEYLTTAKYLVGDDEAVELANEAFKVQDTDIFAEELSSMDIMSRINSHRKAGHAVTEPKYSTKAGKPYHEYVVTDKETGTRRKYIHHGDVSKVENMGAKPKKDEQ